MRQQLQPPNRRVGWQHCLPARGPRGKRTAPHWLLKEVIMPPPEDTLFCAYKETRVPTYHLNSSSPANILRMEKASICDVTSTPNIPPHPIYKKDSCGFHKAALNIWGAGVEENRKALCCSPFEAGAQGGEAGLRATRAWGDRDRYRGPTLC